jgi:undecaprenyl-diphosphatase
MGALLAIALAFYASLNDGTGWELGIVRFIQGADVPGLHQTDLALTQAGHTPLALPLTLLTIIWFVTAGHLRLGLLLGVATGGRILGGFIKILIDRQRPDASQVDLAQIFGGPSFPSGHVLGTTLLLGTIWYAAFHLIPQRPARLAIQSLCVAGMLMMGVARMELGAHWPTDVLGGYLIGGLILMPLIALHRHTTPGVAQPAREHAQAPTLSAVPATETSSSIV